MADPRTLLLANPGIARAVSPETLRAGTLVSRLPGIIDRVPFQPPAPAPPQPAPPTAAPPQPAVPPPMPAIPAAPVESPFDHLPFPSPGDRIKADDFKALSQSIQLLHDLVVLSSTLFGQSYGDVRVMLASRGYQIARVVTVFGNEITNLADTTLDARKVLQISPAAPGHPVVMLVLTEAMDTRRFMPNLVNMNYRTAQSYIQTLLGDVPLQGAPPASPQFVGLNLTDAVGSLPK
jgi:hypothetical protein